MALVWEEAGLAVTCGGVPSEEERASWPDDLVLCALLPEEADDPETIETIRDFVLERTLEARRTAVEELLAPGARLPEPAETESGAEGDPEAAARERRLAAALSEPLDGERDAGWEASGDAGRARDPWLEGCGGTGVRLFIRRVEELVVHN